MSSKSSTKITFPHDPNTTNRVQVAGSFSNWQPIEMSFNETDHIWEIDLYDYLIAEKSREDILGSTYMYKFILNGDNWCCNLLEPTVTDDAGNANHEITITESNIDIGEDSVKIDQLDNTLKLTPEDPPQTNGHMEDGHDDEHEQESTDPADVSTKVPKGAQQQQQPQQDGSSSSSDDVESIDDVAVAEQVNGFLGFMHWLWNLILIRIFGVETQGSSSTTNITDGQQQEQEQAQH